MRAVLMIGPEAKKQLSDFLKKSIKEPHDVILDADYSGIRVTCGDMVPVKLERDHG